MGLVVTWSGPALANLLLGLALLALAAGLLWLNPRHRLNRLFALFLVLRAAQNMLWEVGWVGAGTGDHVLRLRALAAVAQVPALVAFGWAYHKHARGERASRSLITVLVAIALLLPLALFAFPQPGVLFDPATGEIVGQGGFGWLQGARIVLIAVIAFLLAVDFCRQDAGPGRRSALLLSAGFGLSVAVIHVDGALRVGLLGGPGPAPRFAMLGIALVSLVFLAGAALWPMISARRAGDEEGLTLARTNLLFYLVAALSYAAVLVVGGLSGFTPERFGLVAMLLSAAWTFALPLLGAYALLRHQLFGVDLRVRRGVSQATVAAAFIAVFFVVSEGAATLFESTFGSAFLGILAAGLLVFALAPLQRLAQGVASLAVPATVGEASFTRADAVSLYRDQARFAWSDGALDRSERAMLDELRQRLGISRESASRIEEEAARGP